MFYFCCFFCFVLLATHSCFRGGPGSLCSGNNPECSERIRVNQSNSEAQSAIRDFQRFFRDSSTPEKKKPCTTISIEIFDLHWKWNSVIRIAHLEGTEGKRDACFLDLYMFFGPNQNFFGPRVTKNVGGLLVCFLDPVGIFFLDLHVFVLDPGKFFSTA